jgi:hypothetical protein
MSKWKSLAVAFLALACCVGAEAFTVSANPTGTVSIGRQSRGQLIEVVRLDITSHASTGNAIATLTGSSGYLVRFAADPQAASPTASYDLVINDESGNDVLSAAGANLHATNSTDSAITIDGPGTNDHWPVAVNGDLTVEFTNMGNSKQTRIWLYFEIQKRN